MIKIKKRKLSEDIFLLHFKTQHQLASTFLRFQEHYESPKFAGQIFTLREFKQWYSKGKRKFTYYKDWDGFNIPSKIFKKFYNGEFNPLSEREKLLLKLFKNEKHNFYVIAVCGFAHHHVLLHELAHGLYYTHDKYKQEVLKIMKKYDLKLVHKELREKGYRVQVAEDETQAYAVSLYPEIDAEFPVKMRKEIDAVFSKYSPIKPEKIHEFKI